MLHLATSWNSEYQTFESISPSHNAVVAWWHDSEGVAKSLARNPPSIWQAGHMKHCSQNNPKTTAPMGSAIIETSMFISLAKVAIG